jgi:hypothetical protein
MVTMAKGLDCIIAALSWLRLAPAARRMPATRYRIATNGS